MPGSSCLYKFAGHPVRKWARSARENVAGHCHVVVALRRVLRTWMPSCKFLSLRPVDGPRPRIPCAALRSNRPRQRNLYSRNVRSGGCPAFTLVCERGAHAGRQIRSLIVDVFREAVRMANEVRVFDLACGDHPE